MNTNFPRIITLLRKERGLSQKSVAEHMDVSQALLSHYEKGVRECGLEFVVKAADFYGVSCDYLLGRTPNRSGATITMGELPEADAAGKENVLRGSLLPTLNKKLLANSLNVLFGIAQKCNNKALTTAVSASLTAAVYRVFRLLYSSNPKNPQGLFSVPLKLSNGYALAVQERALVQAWAAATGEAVDGQAGLAKGEAPLLSPEQISADYPLFSSSLLTLIQSCETQMGAVKPAK